MRPRVLVTGATSQIGPYLVEKLSDRYAVHCVTRDTSKSYLQDKGVHWHRLDPLDSSMRQIVQAVHPDIWLSVGPLELVKEGLEGDIPSALKYLAVTSSTGVITKQHSKNEKERLAIANLLSLEHFVSETCRSRGIQWNIFCPTLVYGDGRDKNISVIIRLIQRFRFFPVVNGGTGLRQPIHAEDIADAMVKAISNPPAHNRMFVLSGKNTLTYRQMIEVIFAAMKKRAVIVNLPYGFIALAIKLASLVPKYHHLNPEMATRMNENLDFDHADATSLLGFSPRPFDVDSIRPSVLKNAS
jgi:nucleoside-diphosphate-sugar epimerase